MRAMHVKPSKNEDNARRKSAKRVAPTGSSAANPALAYGGESVKPYSGRLLRRKTWA